MPQAAEELACASPSRPLGRRGVRQGRERPLPRSIGQTRRSRARPRPSSRPSTGWQRRFRTRPPAARLLRSATGSSHAAAISWTRSLRRSSARPSPPARPACADREARAARPAGKGGRRSRRRRRQDDAPGAQGPRKRQRKRGEPDDFHDLRKAVKAHAMHLSLLKKFWPSPVKPRRKAVDALGEKLGELHDIFVLRALLRDEAQTARPADRNARCPTASPNVPNESSARNALPRRRNCSTTAPKRSAKKLVRNVRHELAEAQPDAGP